MTLKTYNNIWFGLLYGNEMFIQEYVIANNAQDVAIQIIYV